MPGSINCEILVIGNEILIGKIQDTNGVWITHQLVPHGIKITRITVIQDDLADIADAINGIMRRKPDYVFTTGGLGPTFDDMTIEGISKALGIADTIEVNENAMKWLVERYELVFQSQMVKMKPGATVNDLLSETRKKMAFMPKGCVALRNSAGAAPGVKFTKELTNGHTVIYSLPGVPDELYAIFNEHIIVEILKEIKGHKFTQARLVFEDLGESNLSTYVSNIKDQYPEIWVKTHPHFRIHPETNKKTYYVELHLTSFSTEDGIIQKMDELLNKFEQWITSIGGTILEKDETTQQE